jgi:hypothetical protein
MTKRVFEYDRSWEVSEGGRSVEVYVFVRDTNDGNQGDVNIEVIEEAGWNTQRANFIMTAKEATLLKEFLIRKGY